MNISEPAILSYYREPSKDLRRIQNTYNEDEWNDFLSLQILDWIKSFPSLTQLRSMSTQQIHDGVREKLHVLLEEILVNPLYAGQSLQEPVLDGPWTWEKKWLEIHRSINPTSPLTGQLFATVIKTHSFAKEMILWGAKLAKKLQETGPKEPASPSPAADLSRSTSTMDLSRSFTGDPLTLLMELMSVNDSTEGDQQAIALRNQDKGCLIKFMEAASQYALRTQDARERTRTFERYSRHFKECNEQLQKEIEATKAENAQEEKAFKEGVKKHQEAVEESQRREREELRRHLSLLEQEELAAQARLTLSQATESRLASEAAAARRRVH